MLLKGAYCVGEHFVDPQRAGAAFSIISIYAKSLRVSFISEDAIIYIIQ